MSSVLDHHERLLELARTIKDAFTSRGVPLLEEDNRYIHRLAHWYQGPIHHDHLHHQDRTTRLAIEAVQAKADELAAALAHALKVSGMHPDVEHATGDRLNVARTFFEGEDVEGETAWAVAAVSLRAAEALRIGRPPGGRGQPPKLAYYAFIRELHALFQARSGKRGFRETAGSADGPFIDLMVELQAILPTEMRLNERTTIANRVLQAFTVGIPGGR